MTGLFIAFLCGSGFGGLLMWLRDEAEFRAYNRRVQTILAQMDRNQASLERHLHVALENERD